MVDTISVTERSHIMSLVRAKNTGPEMIVRRLVHGASYRYRLYGKKLPGKPDLVFTARHKVIFVHGCFWHNHDDCVLARIPKSNQDFWETKLTGNKARDARQYARLCEMGWEVMVIWECELKDLDGLIPRIIAFLDTPNAVHDKAARLSPDK